MDQFKQMNEKSLSVQMREAIKTFTTKGNLNLSHIWIGSNWRLDQAWKKQAAKKIKMKPKRMKYAPRHFHAFVGYRKHSLSRHMLLLSCFSCVQLFATLWTIAHQAPLPKGFSRQEYWSGLPCPPPGDLPGPGIELASQAGSLPLVPPGKPYSHLSQSHALGSQKKETESLTLRSS